nr:glycerol-3-phosphate dehydrogenase/oxidase [Rhodococcus sp. (in: high G+C Gram-positive bacteria)]
MTARFESGLDADRRRAELEALFSGDVAVDVLVIGGGITGAGIALDAAARGLKVVLVEKRDLAFGTSRWSSKLVHGGLRYLASGQVSIARESAIERGILMTRTAPHLIRALPQVIPLHSSVSRLDEAVIRAGLRFGDLLRGSAGTPSTVLPSARRTSPQEVSAAAPTVRLETLRGGAQSWDGQLVDDARLVVAVARTAAGHGASILTGVGAYDVDRTTATLRDEETGASARVRAKIVINAAGVWAGEVDPRISLRPSRGTHLVFDRSTFGGMSCSLTVPVPGERNRFVFALPAPLGRVYVGLTDEITDGSIPDVPLATEPEIDFLLGVLATAFEPAPTRADVIGTFAGLRPLLNSGDGPTADMSRRHAVIDDGDGPIGIVGGKLTTYRLMAQHAVDAGVAAANLTAGPCRTAALPLVGAAAPSVLAAVAAPDTLVRRYGTEARLIQRLAITIPGGSAPVADGIDVIVAELAFSVGYEGARSVEDLLDRRTRIGLVAADRERALPVAERILSEYGIGLP